VRPRSILTAICAALLLGACQQPSGPVAPAPVTIVDPAADARGALAAGNCAEAAPHLRGALASDPESVFLHYNLGVCASQLDATTEAIREFRWVVTNADPGSPEAQAARRWLVEAGVLTEGPTAAVKDDATVGNSTLRGVVTWSDPGNAPAPRARQQLFLKGLRGTPTKALQYVRRSDDSGHYEFTNIPPGTYKLTDVIAGHPKWRLRVSLDQGKDVVLDLGPSNAASVRDEFPGD
jgi:hypothetical protein